MGKVIVSTLLSLVFLMVIVTALVGDAVSVIYIVVCALPGIIIGCAIAVYEALRKDLERLYDALKDEKTQEDTDKSTD